MTTAEAAVRGRPKGSHWDGRRLVVRGGRSAVAAPIILVAIPQVMGFAIFVTLWVFTLSNALLSAGAELAEFRQSQMGELLFLGAFCLVLAVAITVEVTIAFATPRTTARLGADGVLASLDYRPDFWIPWDAVQQISVHRSRLLISVAPSYWEYLGRRPLPGWMPAIAIRRSVAAALLPGTGAYPLVMIPIRGSGLSAEQILWCARQVAPASVRVVESPIQARR